jgi:hypothetical protein
MKNQNDNSTNSKPKQWRKLHNSKEPRKSVCGCPFGCLDLDTHYTLNGGRSVFPPKL